MQYAPTWRPITLSAHTLAPSILKDGLFKLAHALAHGPGQPAGDRERYVRVAGRQQAEQLRERLAALTHRGLRERASSLESRSARLTALGPEQTLRRGYSITLDGTDGAIIRETSQTEAGKPITVMLSSGRLAATVEEVVP